MNESLLGYIHFGNINGNPTLKATCILNYSFAFGDTFCLHFEHTSKYLLSRVLAHKTFLLDRQGILASAHKKGNIASSQNEIDILQFYFFFDM